MLLNNFLYTRSLIQNEQYHFRTSFSSLIPKTRINESSKNPLEDEKYKEEIKKIHIGGKNRKERILQREKDKLEEEKKELEAEKEELEEEKEELEEEKEELEEELKDDKEGKILKKKNKELEEEKGELEEENEEFKEENEELEEEKEELEEEKEELEEEKGELEEKNKGKDETISHNFNNREITLDNISKEGGKSYDKDIKNVVVSFF